MDSIIEDKGLMKAVSFGLNEQLITLMAVMSGFLGYSRKRIILALIIMSFQMLFPTQYPITRIIMRKLKTVMILLNKQYLLL